MRLLNIEIDDRVKVKLDKSIKVDDLNGIMKFGENNDYPYIIEKLINGSITAKASANTYSKFLVGNGFAPEINSIIIGKDERNKPVTVLGLLRKVCDQISNHYGVFIHCNQNLQRKNVNLSIIPVKYCRFAKLDDTGYTSKIAVCNNWDEKKTPDPKALKSYNVYNVNEQAFNAQIKALPGNTLEEKVKNFKGQVYFMFLDNQYLYPLSPFDACYLDMDTENQISIFKNNMTRNGMLKKTVLRVAAPNSDEERSSLKREIKNWLGSDGSSTITLEDEIDPATGEIKKSGAFAIDSIDSNIDDKLFENWQKQLANNIRKSMKALPAVLIDYEESKLGTTSGEAIIQATNFYNAITKDDRTTISEMFKELLTNFDDPTLANNTNWEITPLNLYQTNGQSTNIQPANSN